MTQSNPRKVQPSTATAAAAGHTSAVTSTSCKGLLVKRHVVGRLTGFLERTDNNETAHLDILMSCLIQNGSYVFTHEINSQNCYSGAAFFHHLDSPVSHDQAVADVDVGPALCSTGQHPLHFGVHVKVGNNANLLGRQHLYDIVYMSGVSCTSCTNSLPTSLSVPCYKRTAVQRTQRKLLLYISTMVTWTSAST